MNNALKNELFLLGSFLILFIFISTYYFKKRRAKKEIEQIKAAWGNTKTELFHFNGISKYAEEVSENNFHHLNQ